MNNIIEESTNLFTTAEMAKFWSFIDGLGWAPGADCKARLLKDLSPTQSKKYRKILDYVCERLADEISIQFNYNNTFDIKAICSNIIGEHGYNGLINIIENPEKVVEKTSGDVSIFEDIFLFMIPEEDDYWY